MDLEGLREAVRRQPFQPLTIRLADGRAMTIRHPEFVAVGNRRVILVAATEELTRAAWLLKFPANRRWRGHLRLRPGD